MQIQRIQTLMLIIAAVLMAVFTFTPYATVGAADATAATRAFVKDTPALLVLNLAVAALLVITIFMYRNLRRQMVMTIVSIVLICASAVATGFLLVGGVPGTTPVLLGGVALLVLALLFALLAYRGMRRDRRLLASLDRLR